MTTATPSRMTVPRQILVTLAAALAVMVVLVAIALGALVRVAGVKDRILDREARLVVDAHRLDRAVSERGVASRNYLLTGDTSYLSRMEDQDGELQEILRSLDAKVHTAAGRALFEDIEPKLEELVAVTATAIEGRRSGSLDPNELATAIQDSLTPVRDDLKATVDEFVSFEEQMIAAAVAESGDTVRTTIWVLVALGLASIATTLAIGVRVTRSVSRRLTELARSVDGAAAEILSGTAQQAAGASAQAAAVRETVATTDELAKTAEQSADRARAVADRAQAAAAVAREGTEAVAESASAMEEIREQVESIAGTVVALAERAQAISGIVRSVEDIAEQTHLLALNAAIEAAHAGEHGRGFAVVAAEVRALADQSKRATVQIGGILSEIQSGTNTAVMATEQGTKRVDGGVQQVAVTGSTIDELADTVASSSVAAEQISASSGQQAVATAQISQAMRDLDVATQQNAAASRQTEEAARGLREVSTMLKAIVGA